MSRQKIDLAVAKTILFERWIRQHDGLGLLKYQINSFMREGEVKYSGAFTGRLLASLRKQKLLGWSRKRWFMSQEAYKQAKEMIK